MTTAPVTLLKTHRAADHQLLSLHDGSALEHRRWLAGGGEPAVALKGEWWYPELPRPDVSVDNRAELFSDAIMAAVRELLSPVGAWVPVLTDDEPGYHLFACTSVVDCLDVDRSSRLKKLTGEIRTPHFRADAVPAHLPAFRVPQSPYTTIWNRWALDEVLALGVTGVVPRVIWSDDPAYGGQVSALGKDSLYTRTVNGRQFDRWPS